MVKLTESEQRRLREIGRALATEDPALARQLSEPGASRIGSHQAAVGALASSIGAVGVGAAFQLPVLCVTGWIGLILGGAIAFVARTSPAAAARPPSPR
jgi:hypothetical protein